MIIAGGKIYDTCGDCGQLVRVNKPLFGSLHICRGSRGSDMDREAARERSANRRVLRKALKILGLPRGQVDDECMCLEECGVRLGLWCLCYAEMHCGGENGVFLLSDHGDDFLVCEGLPSPRRLAKLLRLAIDKRDLWAELRKAGVPAAK